MYQNNPNYFGNEYNVIDHGGGSAVAGNIIQQQPMPGTNAYYNNIFKELGDDMLQQTPIQHIQQNHHHQQQQQQQVLYNNQNSSNHHINYNNGTPHQQQNNDFHSLLMSAQSNLNGIRPQQQTIVQSQQQQQQQFPNQTNIIKQQVQPNQQQYFNSYGVEESNLLPFSDEKKLILLSALSNDPNLFKQIGFQQLFQQLQPQQQQQIFNNNSNNSNNSNNNVYNQQNFNNVQQSPQLPPTSSILAFANQQQVQQQPPIQPQQQQPQPQQPQQQQPQQQPIQQIQPQSPQPTPTPIATPNSNPPTTTNVRSNVLAGIQQLPPSQSAFQTRSTPIPTPITTPSSSSSNVQTSPPSNYSTITPPITPGINGNHLHSLQQANFGLDYGDESHLTDKQKSRRRASQNLASRNYRQRKKQYMSEIESKLEVIILENDKLKNELSHAKKYIEKLLTELHQLKGLPERKKSDIPGCTGEESDEDDLDELLTQNVNNSSNSPSSSTNSLSNDIQDQQQSQPPVNSPTVSSALEEHDITLLINKLEAGMKLSSDTSIPELSLTLRTFYDTLKSRQNIYVNQIKKIVNPCTQAKLALIEIDINQVGTGCQLQNLNTSQQNLQSSPQQDPNSFMQNTPPSQHDIPSSPAYISLQDLYPSAWLVEFIKDANVSDDQEIRIRTLRQESSYQHSKLLKERQLLNKDIREYYQTKVFKHLIKNRRGGSNLMITRMDDDTSSPVQNQNQSYITELSELLDAMKENLDQENDLLLRTYEQLGMILSPYQEALFITRVYNNLVGDDGDDFSNVQMLHGIWDSILISYDNRVVLPQTPK